MTTRAYLKLADEAEWLALRTAHLTDADDLPLPGVEIDEIGAVTHTTGAVTMVDGMPVQTTVAVPGWLVNLTVAGDFPAALRAFCVNPQQPRRVWFGSYVLAMPEVLEDDRDTVLIERSIGAEASDQQRDAAEIEYVRRKLTAEEREDRKALRQAKVAVVAQRAIRNTLAAQRDALNVRLSALDAERDALVLARTAEVARRAALIATLSTTTEAARIPLVAERDAASAEIARLATEITNKAAEVTATQAKRAVAVDLVIAANVTLLALRAAAQALID